MRIILTTNVKGQGKKGQIIEVKDGYGLNFLVNKGLGVVANNENLKHLEHENVKMQHQKEQAIKEAELIKQKMESLKLTFKVKTGKQDQIFGSITSKQIVEELAKQKIQVDKKKIKANTLCSLGYHRVEIELYKDVIAILKVELVKES